MIHLDTNFLIGSLTSPSALKTQVRTWFHAGEVLAVSAIAWSEFSNGPVTVQQIQDAQAIVQGRIIAFDVQEAEMAAKLFNLTGRKRATQTDCFIAATAICARVPLATLNRKDFSGFIAAGLRLAVP
jgi:predicted nucleic acid-binding protein